MGQAGSFPIVQATIEDCTIRYRSPDSGEVTTIVIGRGRLEGIGTGRSARIAVTGSLDGVPASLAGRLVKAGEVLSGSLEEADLDDLQFQLGDDARRQRQLELGARPERFARRPHYRTPRISRPFWISGA